MKWGKAEKQLPDRDGELQYQNQRAQSKNASAWLLRAN